jgi:TRAP-type mannitol/chloroaromatic compound transport system permease large subunit
MDVGIIGILLFAFLVLLILVGMPIAFAIGLSSLLGIWIFIGPNALSQLAVISYKFGTDSTLVLVPMFVVMAELLSKSGVAEQAFDAGSKWFNRVRGGLGATAEAAVPAVPLPLDWRLCHS